MDCKTKQTQAYEWMLEWTSVPLLDRHLTMRGAEVFFERGWPNNHFTVDMATRAGMGMIPPAYDGPGSEERYFQTLKSEDDASEEDGVNHKKRVQSARFTRQSAMAS